MRRLRRYADGMEQNMRMFARIICIIIAAASLAAALSCCNGPVKNLPDEPGVFSSYKEIPGLSAYEIAQIDELLAKRPVFKYGALYATEAYTLPDGTLTGFTAEFCRLLSELFQAEFVPDIMEWDVLMDGIRSGAVDFTGELTPTEERMGIYDMSLPIAERMLRAVMRLDSEIKTESDFDGLRVGFLSGSVTADSIWAIYHLPMERVYVDNYDEAAEMIKNGDIDAFVDEAVADPVFREYDFLQSQIFFPLVHAPVSMTTANPELAPIINAVSGYINAGGLDKLYEIYKKCDFEYLQYKLSMSLTSEERAYIDDLRNRGAAVPIAFENDNYPINFFNEKDGAYEGIAIDVLKEISRLTGIQFETAVSADATWEYIYGKLISGEVSMVAQLLYSEPRKDHFLWTAPYAHSYYALMSKADFPNIEPYQVARMRVGANKESGKIDIFHEMFPDHDNLIEYDTQYECLDALERGEVDLLMASEYMLLTQINYREKSGFKINIKLDVSMHSGFGFSKTETVLCSIIDKAQQYVKTDNIEMSWTGRNFDYSKRLAEESARSLTIFVIIMLFVLVATMFFLIRSISLGRKLKEMAHNDSLTGIYNRRYFMELASIQTSRSLRTAIDAFIIIFDLDHFKAVNDTYGHLAGDKVLKSVVDCVKRTIRPYDILGRYGGEEFIILMTDIKEINKENVIHAVERIREEICKEPIEYEGMKIPVTASFGISYAAPYNDISAATKYADEALYRAKESGRNRAVFYGD